jgi:NAD(P)-dependent dehydrogenase (short-subunit alcohol dehydrogenase family)
MADRKVAWIVGASSGIGAELARQIAAEGYIVAISARRAERLRAMARTHPALHPYPLDIGDAEAAAAACARILADLGRLDLAIFSAAEWHENRIADYDPARYAAVTRVDYLGAVNMMSPAAEHMKHAGGGQIAVVSSIAGYFGMPSGGPYGPAKAALIQLTQMMHTELAPFGIDVRLVSPGFVETELTARNRYPMPMMMPVEAAGRRIVDGLLRSKRFEIAFPLRAVLGVKLVRLLPYPLMFLAMRRVLAVVRGRPEEPADEAQAGRRSR